MKVFTVSKVVVSDENGQILLIRRSAEDTRRPLQWDIPGGHTDEGEYPAEAAARETYEEAGIQIDPRALQLFYGMTEKVDEGKSGTWLFHLSKVDHTDVILSSEHVEYAWVTLEQALSKIDYHRQKRALQHLQDIKLI